MYRSTNYLYTTDRNILERGIFRINLPEEIILKWMNDGYTIHLLFYNNLDIIIILIIISYFPNYYERRVYIKKYFYSTNYLYTTDRNILEREYFVYIHRKK